MHVYYRIQISRQAGVHWKRGEETERYLHYCNRADIRTLIECVKLKTSGNEEEEGYVYRAEFMPDWLKGRNGDGKSR